MVRTREKGALERVTLWCRVKIKLFAEIVAASDATHKIDAISELRTGNLSLCLRIDLKGIAKPFLGIVI